MYGEWRSDEPNLGTFAQIHKISMGQDLAICVKDRRGEKVWDADGRIYDLDEVEEWRLVEPPELVRLRELSRKIEAAFNSEDGAYDYSGKVTDAIIELREEEQERGWDGTEKE